MVLFALSLLLVFRFECYYKVFYPLSHIVFHPICPDYIFIPVG
nr:MAG TPA: hypothetical protein [Bacteriophage sp.]